MCVCKVSYIGKERKKRFVGYISMIGICLIGCMRLYELYESVKYWLALIGFPFVLSEGGQFLPDRCVALALAETVWIDRPPLTFIEEEPKVSIIIFQKGELCG
jgi:hypothetical protein